MNSLFIFILIFSSGESLNKFLKHFEPLDYQRTDTNRISRSSEESTHLNFNAYGRDFKLILYRIFEKDSVFMKNATIEYANETVQLEWDSNVYRGIVEGDEKSQVFGSISKGFFEGMIRLKDGEEFWVESSFPYNSNVSFHSFIYSKDEMDMSPSGRAARSPLRSSSPHRSPTRRHTEDPHDDCYNRLTGHKISPEESHQKRSIAQRRPFPRQDGPVSKDENGVYSNRLCSVFVQVDHYLHEWMKTRLGEDSKSETRRETITLMYKLFGQVNEIFKHTDFGGIRGIHFKIAGIKIWQSKGDPGYPFNQETNASSTFLEWNAIKDQSKYCLSYVFTYRDFIKDIQGLAYPCFLCTTPLARGDGKSYNVGMISFKNRGSEIPQAKWHLTLAHELGHSLGSNHDEQIVNSGNLESDEHPECIDKEKGKFIMYPVSMDGHETNHRLFSPCSIRNMTRNLRRLLSMTPRESTARDTQTNCLLATDTPICGNGLKEEGEECDCGYDEQECLHAGDRCCSPGNAPDSRRCKLMYPQQHQCAPSQGECCTEECKWKGSGETCSRANDCKSTSKCTGRDASCPTKGTSINEGFPCDDASGICTDGKCDGNICAAEGLKPCDSSSYTCIQHCIVDGVCRSTEEIRQFSHQNYSQSGRIGHPGVMKKPNDNCRNGLGYCDASDRCRDIVNEDIVSQSRTSSGIHTFGELLVEKWWILIIISVVAVIILIASVLICYYKVPKLSLRSPPRECCDTKTMKDEGKSEVIAVEVETKKVKAKQPTSGVSSVVGQRNNTQNSDKKKGK